MILESDYFNYEHARAIVLMAIGLLFVVDAEAHDSTQLCKLASGVIKQAGIRYPVISLFFLFLIRLFILYVSVMWDVWQKC